MFGHSFEGQTRSRPSINLSGSAATPAVASTSASSTTPQAGPSGDSVAQRARQERAQREQQRKLDRTARDIQSFYRSRRQAGQTRDAVRQQYDRLAIGSPTTVLNPEQLLQATSLLAFILSPVANTAARKRRARCSKADLDRLGRWSRTMAVGKPRVALFQQFENFALHAGAEKRYASLLRRLARVMLAQAADNPSSPMLPLFLELVKQMLDPAKFAGLPASSQQFPQELAKSLVLSQAFDDVHEHLIRLQPNTRPTPPSVAPIMAISTALLLRTATTDSYTTALSAFVSNVLTIPQLVSSRRLPSNALNVLTASNSTLPLFDLLGQLSASEDGLYTIASHLCPHLLGNIVTLVRSRLLIQPISSTASTTSLKNGKELAVILDALRHCLEHISPSSLAAEPAGRSASSAIDVSIDSDMAVDAAVPHASTSQPVSPAHSTLDGYTYSILEELVTEPLLSNIVTASTRFSGSSRPALSGFMVALLYSWPSKRETIVNTLVYSDLVAAGRGLIRELWRGWVRTSSLAKAIAGSTSGSTSNVTSSTIAALDNANFKADWPHLILLAELYARTLLTLGDDEFHDKSGNALSAGRATAQSTPSRNPLAVDEVIGLSALFRNIAFALYWQPEVLANSTTGTPNYVVGTKLSLEHLRNLSTNLLQMIHARDSRKQFTPPNHWIMTSQMDLQSFIESAIVEDRALNEDEDSAMPGPGDESDDEDRPRTRAPVARRRNVPTRRQMAFVSPRLGVLNNIPFVIPFETRVSIFQQFVANDREKMGLSGIDRRINFGMDGRRIAGYGTIRRGHVADDGFRAFSGLGSHLKGRLAIRFMDEHGQEEAGIDGGGLFKEFLTSLCKEAFDIDRGLWAENRDHELYPTSTSYSREGHSLQWYAFLGRVLGKALYEGILVDVPFAPFFLSKWLGRASGFDDLASYDPELYQGLVQLKNYAGNVEKDLSLNFTVSEEDFGVSRTIDLIPNGSNVPVTNENRISYIYRVSDYRLNKQIEKQCGAFFSGLSDLVDPKWLRMFNQVELALLVGGAETGISVDDLRHNTVYPRGYDESHPSIQYFWKVVESFSQEDKKALVKFCTSCPRPPLLGFSQLTPKFSIASGGSDENRMPSASTCVNLLKLPTYSSPEQLKQKLLASIHSGAGFDLS